MANRTIDKNLADLRSIKGTDDLLKNAMMAGLAVVVAARRAMLERCFDVLQKQLLRIRRFEITGGEISFTRFYERDDAARPMPELRLLPVDFLPDEEEEEIELADMVVEYNGLVQQTEKLEGKMQGNQQKLHKHVEGCAETFVGDDKQRITNEIHAVIKPYIHALAPRPEPVAGKRVRPEVHWASKSLPREPERFVDDLHGSMRRAGFVPYPAHRQQARDLHTDIMRNNYLLHRYVDGILQAQKLLERLEKMPFVAEQVNTFNAMSTPVACR